MKKKLIRSIAALLPLHFYVLIEAIRSDWDLDWDLDNMKNLPLFLFGLLLLADFTLFLVLLNDEDD